MFEIEIERLKEIIYMENVDSNYTIVPNNIISTETIKDKDRHKISTTQELNNQR